MVLELNQLSKSYGRNQALQNLSLAVEAGSVYGLLGPNGSGKTTTLGLALGVLRASGGTVKWFGSEPTAATRRRIGALLETPNFFPYLTARQNLVLTAETKRIGTGSVAAVLDTVGLGTRQHEPIKGFSLGMKQRLAIGAALLGQPEVLVLDEPTNGLDPQGIAEVRDLVQRLAGEGRTIILASHLLDEIEKVCTHVAVLQKGQLRTAGPVNSILNAADRVVVRLAAGVPAAKLQQALSALPAVHDVKPETNGAVSMQLAADFGPADLNRALFDQGLVLASLEVRHRSLEAQFLELTK
ncbi:ATP-binding cassette domain-containing protein [Hymenobacter sp. BT175]|uniref:ABC transporter ATP-binding protein n=1 Tax=Hymenobacter translucens TaxID=2886507 RepID=UPI001D0E46C2|nr:ATP-binding cassette domain-containing protein [Hymenobacter translucens]MCC2545004.1 ATP-binding cassette domain-containing protein [Hymenobacter translucens]